MIRKIGSKSVHQICSSQVITNLGCAVKELLENSLDANANKIEIILQNYGLNWIKVMDNGDGIQKKDHNNICIKHTTSKIRKFNDLNELNSFGFRGEALSSLCSMSKDGIIIETKFKNDEYGYWLNYDNNGKLIHSKVINKNIGTTITVKSLFHMFPVRLNSFKKNIKKEYNILLNIIQGYAIIQSGVKIILRNNKNIIINTQGSTNNNNNTDVGNIKNNIVNVFGYKEFKKLEEINEVKMEINEQMSIVLVGWISNKNDPDCGRTRNDRQFLWINKRPIDHSKIARIINNSYKSNVNKHKYPIYFINIKILSNYFDINIDPNKRSVFIDNENDILLKLREYFDEFYQKKDMVYHVKQLDSFINLHNNNNNNNDNNNENITNKKDSSEETTNSSINGKHSSLKHDMDSKIVLSKYNSNSKPLMTRKSKSNSMDITQFIKRNQGTNNDKMGITDDPITNHKKRKRQDDITPEIQPKKYRKMEDNVCFNILFPIRIIIPKYNNRE